MNNRTGWVLQHGTNTGSFLHKALNNSFPCSFTIVKSLAGTFSETQCTITQSNSWLQQLTMSGSFPQDTESDLRSLNCLQMMTLTNESRMTSLL